MDWLGHIDKVRMDDLHLGALGEVQKYGLDSCLWVWCAVACCNSQGGLW